MFSSQITSASPARHSSSNTWALLATAPFSISILRVATLWAVSYTHLFYDAFYVYQYATGYSSAVKLAEDILSGDGEAVRRYRAFLRSGGSDYPIRLLQNAGVDLTGPEPVARCLKYFSHTLAQLEALL